MLSEADILAALSDCYDPETKLNLVDLGLIYRVSAEPDPDSTPAWPRQRVRITITLTKPEHPARGLILEQAQNRMLGIPEISKVQIDLVWEPKWTPERISESGRRQLARQSGLVSIKSSEPANLG